MADAQYVIDVAAGMSGGVQTVAQLDALSSTLLAAGVSADNLQDAVALASNALAAAKTSTADANAALAEGAAAFADLEKAAVQAAKAQEKAAKLGVVPPETAAALDAANAALAEQTSTLRGLEAAAGGAAQKEAQLAQTLAKTQLAASSGNKALAEQARQAEKAQQAQAAATKKSIKEAEGFAPAAKQLGDFSDAISSSEGRMILLSGAAVGAAAAIAAITVAVLAGVAAFGAYAIGLADAKQQADLTTAAHEALAPGLVELRGDFAALQADTGASAADLRTWTKQLDNAKVAAEDIPAALRAVALADAALGKGQGMAAFQDDLKETKRDVAEVAESFDKNLSGIVAQKMRGLDAQGAKLKKNFTGLFDGLDIEPVLAGLETLVALFDENTAAGSAIKLLFETVFQPLIDQAQNAAYVIEAFALGFLIGLTKVYIAIKPAIKAVSEFFGFEDTSLSDVLDIATKAGEYAAYIFVGFVAALAAVAAVVGLVIAQLVLAAAAVVALVAGVVAAGIAIYEGFVSMWQAAVDWLNGLIPGMGDIASDIMMGLVGGIVSMGPAIVNAMTGAVGGAIDAAKKLLGIASPSTVFAAMGVNTGEGFVEGVDAMAGDAQAAMAGMVEPPDTSSPTIAGNFGPGNSASSAASVVGGGGRPGGGSLLGSDNTFIFNGVADAEQAEQRFEEMLTRVLEGDASALVPEGALA